MSASRARMLALADKYAPDRMQSKAEPSHDDVICPCSYTECFCDCVSDWTDCVCTCSPRPFTDDEVSAFRIAHYDTRPSPLVAACLESREPFGERWKP